MPQLITPKEAHLDGEFYRNEDNSWGYKTSSISLARRRELDLLERNRQRDLPRGMIAGAEAPQDEFVSHQYFRNFDLHKPYRRKCWLEADVVLERQGDAIYLALYTINGGNIPMKVPLFSGGDEEWAVAEAVYDRNIDLSNMVALGLSSKQLQGLLVIAATGPFPEMVGPILGALAATPPLKLSDFDEVLRLSEYFGRSEYLDEVLVQLYHRVSIDEVFTDLCQRGKSAEVKGLLKKRGAELKVKTFNEVIVDENVDEGIKKEVRNYDENPGWNVVRAVMLADNESRLKGALRQVYLIPRDAINIAFFEAFKRGHLLQAEKLLGTGQVSKGTKENAFYFLQGNEDAVRLGWLLDHVGRVFWASSLYEYLSNLDSKCESYAVLRDYSGNDRWNILRAAKFSGDSQDLRDALDHCPFSPDEKRMEYLVIVQAFDIAVRLRKPAHVAVLQETGILLDSTKDRMLEDMVTEGDAEAVRVLLQQIDFSEETIRDVYSSINKQYVREVFFDEVLECLADYTVNDFFLKAMARVNKARMTDIATRAGAKLSYDCKADALFFFKEEALAKALLEIPDQEPVNDPIFQSAVDHHNLKWGLAKRIFKGETSEFLNELEGAANLAINHRMYHFLNFTQLARLFRYATAANQEEMMVGLALTMVEYGLEIKMDELTTNEMPGRQIAIIPFLYNGDLWERLELVAGERERNIECWERFGKADPNALCLEESVQVMRQMRQLQYTFFELDRIRDGLFSQKDIWASLPVLWQGLEALYPFVLAVHKAYVIGENEEKLPLSPFEVFRTKSKDSDKGDVEIVLPPEVGLNILRLISGLERVLVDGRETTRHIEQLMDLAIASKFGPVKEYHIEEVISDNGEMVTQEVRWTDKVSKPKAIEEVRGL